MKNKFSYLTSQKSELAGKFFPSCYVYFFEQVTGQSYVKFQCARGLTSSTRTRTVGQHPRLVVETPGYIDHRPEEVRTRNLMMTRVLFSPTTLAEPELVADP